MAGTFLHSFMICLQRLDQSGSPVAADEEEKSNVTPCLMSPPRPTVGDRSPSRAGTALWPGAGAESPTIATKNTHPATELSTRPDKLSSPNRN